MKTAIKLLLLYWAFQFLGALLVMIPNLLYTIIKYGSIDQAGNPPLAPALLLSFAFMALYLWKAGYIRTDKAAWSSVSASYLLMSAVICFAAIFIVDYVHSLLPWLPNLMEQAFDVLQSGWLGILCIAILGPVIEELIFRGAITQALLKKYSPAWAIVISALVFGLFHINPAQIVSATLIGLLLAWIYYKTASLVPCILIHILNNTLSVYLNIKYPAVENMEALFTPPTYYALLGVAAVAFAATFWFMKKTTIPYSWKGQDVSSEALNQP